MDIANATKFLNPVFLQKDEFCSYSKVRSQFCISCLKNINLIAIPKADYQEIDLKAPQTKHNTADRLAQLVEHQTTVREVAGSNLGRTNTQGL